MAVSYGILELFLKNILTVFYCIYSRSTFNFCNFKENLTIFNFASQIKLLYTKNLCLGPDLAWAGLYLSDSAGLNKYGNKDTLTTAQHVIFRYLINKRFCFQLLRK